MGSANILSVLLLAVQARSGTATLPGDITVASTDGSTAVELSAEGKLLSVAVNGVSSAIGSASGIALGLGKQSASVVTNSSASQPHVQRLIPGGGVRFSREVVLGPHAANVSESIVPAPGGSVAWELTVQGTTPELWAPSINIALQLPTVTAGRVSRKIWLPWSSSGLKTNMTGCNGAGLGSPLSPLPVECFGTRKGYPYGSWVWNEKDGAVSVPLIALLDENTDSAVSLSLAPAPNLLSVSDIYVFTNSGEPGGIDVSSQILAIAFGPSYRVSAHTAPLKLRFHISGSKACSRHILHQYANELHPEYFLPPNSNVYYRAGGMGTYAATQGPVDQLADGSPLIDTLKHVGLTTNWDATFWFPYIMMIAPTIDGSKDNRTELWGSDLDPQTGYNNRLAMVKVHSSYALRNAYYKKWQAANVTVLGYFNGWELGQNMSDYPPDPQSCPKQSDLWRHAPCFIHKYFDKALCTNKTGGRMAGPNTHLWWDGDTQLDPGFPVYRKFLKTMVQNHLEMEPHFMGLASDGIRACLNFAGDDGIATVYNNGSLALVQDGWTAWAALMAEIGPMLHDRDKLMSSNTINGVFIHNLRHVDLIITELLASSYQLSGGNAWVGLNKPVTMWTTGIEPDDCANCTDLFFSRLLHLGLFPMPPMPSADHCLATGDRFVHEQFMIWGPLFRALKGRKWVLRPHAISVKLTLAAAMDSHNTVAGGVGCTATIAPPPMPGTIPLLPPIANVFLDLNGSEIIVITSPGQPVASAVTATLRNVTGASTGVMVTALRPGDTAFVALPSSAVQVVGDEVHIMVIPCRGAVVLRVSAKRPMKNYHG
eukprot:SAG31_NODE_554_length_14181_cov_22.378000_3_plen_824_part_00